MGWAGRVARMALVLAGGSDVRLQGPGRTRHPHRPGTLRLRQLEQSWRLHGEIGYEGSIIDNETYRDSTELARFAIPFGGARVDVGCQPA